MAQQVATNPTGQASQEAGHHGQHGRASSWVVTTVIVVGFIVGGIALPVGPVWWLFWLGAGIVVVGAIIGAATHILEDWY